MQTGPCATFGAPMLAQAQRFALHTCVITNKNHHRQLVTSSKLSRQGFVRGLWTTQIPQALTSHKGT
eukprot:5033497-Amphidinium_carterae.1